MRGRQQEALTAYQWTVAAIVLLAAMGVLAVALLPSADLDRLVNALQFIAVATGGLVGVASGFRPRSREDSEKGMIDPEQGEP